MTPPLASDLFGTENRLFTLPAGADFLGELAKTLIDVTSARQTPEQLSDALIFVPNRRSARALAARLFQELDTPGFLPPDIRPLGDAGDNDPALLGELTDVDVRPSMPAGSRLGALTRLVKGWHDARGESLTLASAMSVAKDLARLLDQAALTGDVNWEDLEGQVEQTDLAIHWKVSVDFLKIITENWPVLLEQHGYSDTNEQDRLAAEAMCARWERQPPSSPVIIAGSTGTTPATQRLMSAVRGLPKGAILFPGLDQETDAATWQAISKAPSHPQHAFTEALAALDEPLNHVRLWPGFRDQPRLHPRRKLIQESLAPADATADWVTRLQQRAAPLSPQELTQAGLEGLSLIETANEAEEADVIALLMRETLETPGKTAALVTPDSGLARRVSAVLRRWELQVSPSSGFPLLQTRAGQFLIRALDFALDPADPVVLASLLKHPLAVFLTPEERTCAVSLLERGVLRGLRRWTDLKSLYDHTRAVMQAHEASKRAPPITMDEYAIVLALIDDLTDRFQLPLEAIRRQVEAPFRLRDFTEAFAAMADGLSREPDDENPSLLWSGSDGSAVARMLEDIAQMGDWLSDVNIDDLRPLFTSLAGDIRVPDDLPGHPRLFIWGPLEARLQTCDLMILSGLNESSWPEQPGVDGFLPRHIRAKIGLPDTETRIGLSAHDFAQMACTPDVVLTRSERIDNKPGVASRWLWRLRILASGALGSLEDTDKLLRAGTEHILTWARAQHLADEAISISSPSPKPPASARTSRIRVTDVENLIRDPYAFYAKTILRLEPLEPLGAEISPQAIGIAMHTALEGVDTLKAPYFSAGQLVSRFDEEMRKVGADDLFIAEREAIWRFVSGTYLDWMKKRDSDVVRRRHEVDYGLDLHVKDRHIQLIGRADMVETLHSGEIAITDFKTGRPPSKKQVKSGLSPQLPLLVAMARLDTSDRNPNGEPADLFYIGFGASGGVEPATDGKTSPKDLAEEALFGLQDLLGAFADPTTPYLSGPRVEFLSSHSDYDRLSRKQEWADPGHEGSSEASS